MVVAKGRNSIKSLNELIPAISFITNKITKSCIFGKKLNHVWILKTIKSNIFQPLSWGCRHRMTKDLKTEVEIYQILPFLKSKHLLIFFPKMQLIIVLFQVKVNFFRETSNFGRKILPQVQQKLSSCDIYYLKVSKVKASKTEIFIFFYAQLAY